MLKDMNLNSPMFDDGEPIPTQYTCDGEDMNPPLVFLDVPSGAESLALVMDDPDAPGKVWTHWLAYNISPDTREIKEDSLPQGAVQGVNDFGNSEYGGPCPPADETHTYHFKLYALDTDLNLPEGSTKTQFEHTVLGHTIAMAELTGTYQRT